MKRQILDSYLKGERLMSIFKFFLPVWAGISAISFAYGMPVRHTEHGDGLPSSSSRAPVSPENSDGSSRNSAGTSLSPQEKMRQDFRQNGLTAVQGGTARDGNSLAQRELGCTHFSSSGNTIVGVQAQNNNSAQNLRALNAQALATGTPQQSRLSVLGMPAFLSTSGYSANLNTSPANTRLDTRDRLIRQGLSVSNFSSNPYVNAPANPYSVVIIQPTPYSTGEGGGVFNIGRTQGPSPAHVDLLARTLGISKEEAEYKHKNAGQISSHNPPATWHR
jgi:hypothetical protein